MKLTTRQLTLCAVLTAMALALSYLENFFPLSLAIPIPGIKLGLANIVTLFALYALGPGQALLILLARCLLGAVFAGNMNALIFSLLGGVTAMGVMIALSRLKRLSVYGVSVGGAAAHNCGQVAAAVLTLGNTAPLYYLPVLLGVSLFTGALTGLIAACLFRALATGTGLIAKHIVNAAAHIEATDASAEMIAKAKRDNQSAKLHFSVQDMFRLPYADKSFDVVIVSNALHIVPQPEKALQEIKRVLKDGGVLIAPTFTHAGNSFSGKVKAFFMKLAGFPLHSRWASEEYLRFLRQNGWAVRKSAVLKASFPLTYAECVKSEV